MLPEVLNNHFDYLIPDEIVPLVVGEGDIENSSSDSEDSDSYHGFDSASDVPSDGNIEPSSNVHAPNADTLKENFNVEKNSDNNVPTNPLHAPGAVTKPKSVKFTVPENNKNSNDPRLNLNLPCTPTSPPWLSPSGTRSGSSYLNPNVLGNLPASSASASPSLLGRTGKMLGKLMDSHPLAEPKRKK